MKNKFIKSTFILIIGGLFTKILGLIIKIVSTRLIGTIGIGMYSMIMPTFLLLNNIAQLGLPTALNILISSNKYNNKNIIITAIMISLTIEFIIIIILSIFNNSLSILLFNNKDLSLGLFSISLVLPFITISNCIRSYFFAKEKMLPHVITNIIEDIIKLILIIIGIPLFISKGIKFVIAYLILTNILCELSTIIIFIILLPKNKININNIDINKSNIKSLLTISIPTTFSRIIGSIGYFFEPIIITYVLTKIGYTNDYIIKEYGIINGYVMQLVLLPSFFTSAISQALIPIVSKNYACKNIIYIKKKIKQAIIISLLIGIPATILFELFPKELLYLLFKNSNGYNYIKVIAPICILHYIQAPISSSLQAMGKAKIALLGTFIGMILRTIILFIFSYMHIGLWSLIIATSVNIIFVTLFNLYNIKKVR